jgi:hypothetical protein
MVIPPNYDWYEVKYHVDIEPERKCYYWSWAENEQHMREIFSTAIRPLEGNIIIDRVKIAD